MSPDTRPQVLYITRTGMLEPLGQSQVLSYLRGLSRDYRIILVSFEKPEDRADLEAWERIRGDCATHGIQWKPQAFHHRPRLLAAGWSFVLFVWICLRLVRRENISLIHARSYLPAAVALFVNRLTGVPFIFDMRALWPEELIASGRVRRGSLFHRALLWVERSCLRQAAGVVSLTQAAIDYLRRIDPTALTGQRVVVIPTCADLDRFVPADERPPQRTYGCVGTVHSGWFRLDWLAAFFKLIADADPNARFEIVTRDDAEEVRRKIGSHPSLQNRLNVYPVAPHLAHQAMQRHSVSVMFYADDLSRIGCSPTRMGEALGCGIPVVTNPGVGDTGQIVESRGIGVLAHDCSGPELRRTLDRLDLLLDDVDLPQRCRQTAEALFSLEAGTGRYDELYRAILSK